MRRKGQLTSSSGVTTAVVSGSTAGFLGDTGYSMLAKGVGPSLVLPGIRQASAVEGTTNQPVFGSNNGSGIGSVAGLIQSFQPTTLPPQWGTARPSAAVGTGTAHPSTSQPFLATARTLLCDDPPEELLKEANCTLDQYRALPEEEKIEVLGLLDKVEVGGKMGQFYQSTANADEADAQGRSAAAQAQLVAEGQRKMRAEGAESWAQETLKVRGALRKILSPVGKGKKPDEPNDGADDDCRDCPAGFDPKEWAFSK